MTITPQLLTQTRLQSRNITDIVGQMSASALSLALNSGTGATWGGNATEPRLIVGTIRVPLIERQCYVELRIERGFVSGETLQPALRWINLDGSESSLDLDVGIIGNPEISVAGMYAFGTYAIPELPVGTVMGVEWLYTVGPAGSSANMALAFQIT